MGRRTKLTDETRDKLYQALDLGVTFKQAAAYAGIDEATFYRWMNTKREFCESIRAREGRAVVSLLALVQQAAREDWHAAAWILEHRWPGEYARNRIEIEHHGGQVDITLLADLAEAVKVTFPGDAEAQERLADALVAMGERQEQRQGQRREQRPRRPASPPPRVVD